MNAGGQFVIHFQTTLIPTFSRDRWQIGITDSDEVARIVNTLSHKTVFRYEAKEMVEDNLRLFNKIFSKLMDKYNFVIH